MLRGKRIGLTAVEESDLPQLMEWRNNPEYRKFFREYREINTALQKTWFEDQVLRDPSTRMFSIRELSTHRLLGCCGLVYINWVYRHADLSLYIGADGIYIDENGYAEDVCQVLLNYAFNELGLNKVWTEIYEFDEKKKKLYDKLGFNQDGLLRQDHFYDGKWWNTRVLSLLTSEFSKKKS